MLKKNSRNLKITEFRNDIESEIKQAEETRLRNQSSLEYSGKLFLKHRDLLRKGYQIQRLIGSGSYAHVFKAIDRKKSIKYVALKLIEMKKCSRNYLKRFLRNEIYIIRILTRSIHPNIVGFVEAFNIEQPNAYVMVMEFIENGTLNDRICREGALSEKIACTIFYGIVNGLMHMHRNRIAHRDLKLENVLLTNNDVPKICDFSLSILWDGGKLSEEFCGTPPFFSPEIYQKYSNTLLRLGTEKKKIFFDSI